MALRLIGNATKRIAIDEDYIDVAEDISKRQFGQLLRTIPRDQSAITAESAENFTSMLFELFVKGWSLTNEQGKAIPVSLENYFSLYRESANSIDSAVLEHFNALTPTTQESDKSEDDSGA